MTWLDRPVTDMTDRELLEKLAHHVGVLNDAHYDNERQHRVVNNQLRHLGEKVTKLDRRTKLLVLGGVGTGLGGVATALARGYEFGQGVGWW